MPEEIRLLRMHNLGYPLSQQTICSVDIPIIDLTLRVLPAGMVMRELIQTHLEQQQQNQQLHRKVQNIQVPRLLALLQHLQHSCGLGNVTL